MGRDERIVLEPLSQDDPTTTSDNSGSTEKPAGLGGVMIGIGEQVYSILLLSFFFLEVYATGFIPYIGKALNFVLLSWMYAYYCFEYKWNLSEVALDRRLDFFESNWAFFAGFGKIVSCWVWLRWPTLLSSLALQEALVFWLFSSFSSCELRCHGCSFPLFVLTATSSGAEQLVSSQRRKWKGAGLGRLPIFYAADTLSLRILSLIPLESHEQMQDNKEL
ncbi:hypothetical protein GH714_005464 [Hevea brasiliensis]|uniref:Protein EI24 homolog n=1 Tax=Hevea brasiliensis TaxID=3981 RepID=A0A6A6L0X6_HEVBR|nr:hypothetical protein GH714_005464 [Hevea brasiliensis]